jgi:hypothetical protein
VTFYEMKPFEPDPPFDLDKDDNPAGAPERPVVNGPVLSP